MFWKHTLPFILQLATQVVALPVVDVDSQTNATDGLQARCDHCGVAYPSELNYEGASTQVCVKYSDTSPDNIWDTINWYSSWLSEEQHTADPEFLKGFYEIPDEVFNCPAPTTGGQYQPCVVPTEQYCFTAKGSEDELNKAFDILSLVAKYRVAQSILQAMYTFALVPPDGSQYGKGLARDFAEIVNDFFNGAYGDSSLPASDMLDVVGSIILWAPYDLSISKTVFNANAQALAAAKGSSLDCTYGQMLSNQDCLLKPGFGGVFAQYFSQRQSFDQQLNYLDVVKDASQLTIPLNPDISLLTAAYANYRSYFQRAMFMEVQRAQSLFIHVQPYDQADQDSYWEIQCPAIVGGISYYWCNDQDGHDSRALYPCQIGTNNGSVHFDYAPWGTLGNYGWDGNKIMSQSLACANTQSQSYDLQPNFPQIFSMISDQDTALAWYKTLTDDPDATSCLWSIPILEYSDGPNFSGGAKAWDTPNDISSGIIAGENPFATNVYHPSERTAWKYAADRGERVWDVVRNSDYCPIFTNDDITPWGAIAETLKLYLGWGEIAADDQIVADIWGAQRLVTNPSQAWQALDELRSAACDKLTKDSYADIAKTSADLLLNIAVFWYTGGGSFLTTLVFQSASASIIQTIADTFWLQPWLDGILKQQFQTPSGFADQWLAPIHNTEKPGEGQKLRFV